MDSTSLLSLCNTIVRAVACLVAVLVMKVAIRSEHPHRPKFLAFGRGFLVLFCNHLIASILDVLSVWTGREILVFFFPTYYALDIIGLLMFGYGVDTEAYAERPDLMRSAQKFYTTVSFSILGGMILLTVEITFHSEFLRSIQDLGFRLVALSCVYVWAVVFLGYKILVANIPSFTDGQQKSAVLAFGCLLLAILTRDFADFREPFSTISFMILGTIAACNFIHEQRQFDLKSLLEKDREIHVLQNISRQLSSTFDLEAILESFLHQMVSTTSAEAGAVFVVDKVNRELRCCAVRGCFPPPFDVPPLVSRDLKFLHELLLSRSFPIGEGIPGRVAETAEEVIIEDARYVDDSVCPQTIPDLLEIQSTVAFPIKDQERVYAVVQIVNRRDGKTFTLEDRAFMRMIVEQAAHAVQSAVLHQELVQKQQTEQEVRMAQDIQRRLVPAKMPDLPDCRTTAYYKSARQIGGDSYDCFLIDDRRVALSISDVSGKGVPAALVMAVYRTLIRTIAQSDLTPANVLARVNEALSENLQSEMFVTAIQAVYDRTTRRLTFCRAGHKALLVYRDASKTLEEFQPRGIAIGFVRGPMFLSRTEEKQVELQPGDVVLFYTDGVTEAKNSEGEEFGVQRLREVFLQAAQGGVETVMESIRDQLEEFQGEAEQFDDITVVAFTVTKTDGENPSSS